jgi:hypothetical protein
MKELAQRFPWIDIEKTAEFDLLMVPNSGHGYTPGNYVMRRRWDYFVKHLLGVDPPRDYVIPSPPGGGRRGGGPSQ